MKNPHIELVKKWLADPKSVSQEELERAAAAADAADADAADAADVAAVVAVAVAVAAASRARVNSVMGVEHWVERYEEMTQ
tara:strand:- start:830 stop:1072 length:243 start_codon:yes stop_codon:yes gene_type:complete